MKNRKSFLTLVMGITIFANCVCEDSTVSTESEQDTPEVIVIEAIHPAVMIGVLLHECFDGNNIQACQFSIQAMSELGGAKIGSLSRKIFEQDQKIASQEEKINKQEKIIEKFRAKEKRRAERRICKKKMEKEADKKTAYNSLLE